MKERLVKNAEDLIQERLTSLKNRKAEIEEREQKLSTLPSQITAEKENFVELREVEAEAKKESVSDEELAELKKALDGAKKKDKKEAEKAVQEAIQKRESYRRAIKRRELCEKRLNGFEDELADIKAKREEEQEEYKRILLYIEEAKICLSIVKTEVSFKDKLATMKKDCINQRKAKGWVDNCKGCPHWSEKYKKCSGESLFSGNPSHWGPDEIEETLDRNFVERCKRG